jgi:hypothetical protein
VIRPRTPSARRSFRAGSAVAALLVVLLAAAFLPAAAAAEPIYWGGTIKGDVYGVSGEAPTSATVLERFEHDTGKQISMVNTGQSWVSFNAPTMEAAIAAGEVPLVTMRLEGATLKEVIEGKQDAAIENWARAAKAFGYPFLFRPWWEVNGTWYSWGRSPEYVEAWRHFHDVVERVGARNVTWAWVVNTIWHEDPNSNPEPWYPGSEYVDWVGMDAYNWGKNPLQPASWLNAEESIQPTLNILEHVAPGKPVCICESASTEYDEEGQPPKPAKKAAWIHEMLDTYLPSHPEIKSYLWFNWNAEKDGGTPGQRYDWPIESSTASETAFREGISSSYYLAEPPPLRKGTKVPIPGMAEEEPAEESVGGAGGTGTVAAPTGTASGSGAKTATANIGAKAEPVAFGAARPGGSGTAKLPLWVPGAGDLRITARGGRVGIVAAGGPPRRGISRHVPARERFTLAVSASGPTLRRLHRRGTATVSIQVRFTPTGGTTSTRRLTVTLRAQS